MGLRELEQAFSRAGIRSTDRADFLEELEDYRHADPPVSLWTNSQFGVGVLSYFMLATRVDITTTLYERNGSLGRQLRVVIPNQGAEFEIHDDGPGTQQGTTIRLRLKPGVSVSGLSTLRDLVILCPFGMTADDDKGLRHEWGAGDVNISSRHVRTRSGSSPVEDEATGIWWVDGWGPVLSDGIWAESFLYGAIINLTGDQLPKLTIDRRRILEFDEAYCDRVTLEAIPTAIGAAWQFVGTQFWLDSAFPFNPALVDAIVESASERADLVIQQKPKPLNVAVAGYLVGDGDFDRVAEPMRAAGWSMSRRIVAGAHPRFGNRASNMVAGVVRASPTDAVFLATAQTTSSMLTIQEISPWDADATAIYDAERHLRWPIDRVVSRARVLGLPVPAEAESLPPSNDFIRALLNRNSSWNVDEPREFKAFDVILTAWDLQLPFEEADEILRTRKLEVQPTWRSILDAPPTPFELVWASKNADGVAPWRLAKSAVSMDAVFRASMVLQSTVGEVTAGLRRLGFRVDVNSDYEPFELDHVDLLLVSRDLDGLAPFLERAYPISKKRLEKSVSQTDHSEDEVRRRFGRLGHPVWPEIPETLSRIDGRRDQDIARLAEHLHDEGNPRLTIEPMSLTREDVSLAALDYVRRIFWPRSSEIPYLHVWSRAKEWGRPEKKVVRRLERLGYTTAPNPFGKLKSRDRALLNRGGNGGSPWRALGDTLSLLEVALVSQSSGRSMKKVLVDAQRLGLLIDASSDDFLVVRPGPVTP
ncbi:hypothetical protein B7R22_11760 [Subtercola boreus]|uniref:wHTH-Hsp90 Na associated domain-containing protein n=2 Tax=Subtercola boreus TaxID=120213 RepID=A0A3E0VWQ9_9MICO|nr:hypothetical protein B7R22_11760 [Subtercola boreus]